jgi:hypothetical protein
MGLGAGFDGGVVNFNFWAGKVSRKGAKELVNFNYGSEWRL